VHELSVCQALLAQVTDIAMNRGASVVMRITIEVGPLSGIEPDLLANAFNTLRSGSCAAEAILSIDSPPIRIRCMSCGAQSCAGANRLICPACGEFDTRVESGDELRLCRVELRVPQPLAATVQL
jgi:hydrogenase nickel incorporation protein HypA/HybF